MHRAVLLKISFALLSLMLTMSWSRAQTDKPAPADEKAEKIVQKAIQAVGDRSYLNINTVIGRGFFTEYKDGVSQIPVRFIDYISYPDRERTEFSGGGARTILGNSGTTGWLFNSAAKTLKDQNAGQLEDFHFAMITSMENLLHGWWRPHGAVLSYAGRREAGLARRNETVRLVYPNGFSVEYEFSANEGLPSKVLYKRKHKKPDTEEMEEIAEEDRLQKPISIDGVLTPFVIDHFRNGIQTSRINYEKVEYNQPLADSLFAKPASFKAVK